MKRQETMRLDRQPFDPGAQAEDMESREQQEFGKARFVLFLRYLKRFSESCGLNLEVPEYRYVPFGKEQPYRDLPESFGWSLFDAKKRVLEKLFADVMRRCGWEIGKVVPERPSWKADTPAAAEKWKELEKGFSARAKLSGGCRLSCIRLCWNERLYRYHCFAAGHADLVHREAGAEDTAIRQILRQIADPLFSEIGTLLCGYGEHYYYMLFYEGYMENYTVSMTDMDYNFFIRVIVLDMLLAEAEKLFGYREKEEAHDLPGNNAD